MATTVTLKWLKVLDFLSFPFSLQFVSCDVESNGRNRLDASFG